MGNIRKGSEKKMNAISCKYSICVYKCVGVFNLICDASDLGYSVKVLEGI